MYEEQNEIIYNPNSHTWDVMDIMSFQSFFINSIYLDYNIINYIIKLGLEKAEEPEVKLPTFAGS